MFLALQKAHFLELLEFTLNIAWIFLDQLSQSSHMSVKIRIFGIDYYNFPPHPRCNEYV